MRESEYVANLELARGAQRRHAQVYKPEKKENRALRRLLIGILLALGV